MHRRKDNYSDGGKSKKGNLSLLSSFTSHSNSEIPRHYSFNARNPSPSDSFGLKQKDALRNTRIIQKNLVHVIGLPQSLSNQDIASPQYFGKYGIVEKYSLYPITRNGNKKKIYSYTAYITYMTELQASLAIIALDGKTLGDRLLKLSFGTTKYCSYFTKNLDCPNIKECLFLHQWHKQNEIVIQEQNSRNIFKDQFKIALKIVKQGLDTILRRKYSIDEQTQFPSVFGALTTLIQKKLINQQSLKQKLQQYNPSRLLEVLSSHRKSVSSISTNFSYHKQEPEQEPLKIDSINQLIQKYLIRSLIKRTNNSYSRLIASEGQEDLVYADNVKNYICKQVIFSQLSL